MAENQRDLTAISVDIGHMMMAAIHTFVMHASKHCFKVSVFQASIIELQGLYKIRIRVFIKIST